MTRLYTSISCRSCGQVVGADIGTYFGKKLGDKGTIIAECDICKAGRLFDKAKQVGLSDEEIFSVKTLNALEEMLSNNS